MLEHTSLFSHHPLLITEFNNEIIIRPALRPVLILCAILLLLAIIRTFHRNRFDLIVRSLFSQRFYSLLIQDGKIFRKPIFLLTLVCDILIFASTLQLIVRHFVVGLSDKVQDEIVYGILVAGLLILYFVKLISNHIYAKLYNCHAEAYPMNLYKFIFITNAAILLLPFLIIAQFSRFFVIIYAYIPILIVLFLIYIYKLIILNPKKINLFQFFIYFCTLEILPYLLLVKLIAKI